MTNEGKRQLSRIEFENTYRIIDDDIERMITNNFGLKGEKVVRFRSYLDWKIPVLEQLSQDLYIHLKMANSLYPSNKAQLEERQMHQKYATGICYAIVSLYERIFQHIGIRQDKFVEEIRHIQKEINAIKAWRESDRKRFRF